jgi:serine/threonine-protein kinase
LATSESIGVTTPPPVRVGDVLAGKYRVDRVLGVGGMGVVVAAHHIQLDDRVAIKFMLPEVLHNHEAVERFAREARAAVKIKSEHVARVSDVGTLETGAPYMVMEYLEGSDLSAFLEQQGTLPIEQLVEFVLQACEALAEAHAYGIVHRDLKPANLFVTRRPDGRLAIKVLDFGISKMISFGDSGAPMSMTTSAALLGSPLYMSPEQMRSSRDVDARSDIWSLGVILYEMLAGASPFAADNLPDLVVKVMSTTPPPLRDVRPDAPPGIEAVVLTCLQKDRDRRYQNVAGLAIALAPFGSHRSRASVERISGVMQSARFSSAPPANTPPMPSASPRIAEHHATGATWGKTGSLPKPRRTTALVVASTVAVAVAIAIGALSLFFGRPTAPAAPVAAAAIAVPVLPVSPPTAVPVSPEPSAVATADVALPQPTPPAASASVVHAKPPTSGKARNKTSLDLEPYPAPSAAAAHHNPLDIRPQ